MSDDLLVVTTVEERHDLVSVSQDCTTVLEYEYDEQLIVEITEDGDNHQELQNGNGENVEETENNDMERVIDSEIFREELQEMVAEQMSNNTLASNQPLLDVLSIRQRFCKADRVSKQVDWAVVPVSDIRGVETSNYAKNEKLMRSRLASCYRLVDLFEWTDGLTSGCVTARVDDETDGSYMLVAPQCMICDEVTASSLIKISVNGSELLDEGSTQLGIDSKAVVIHSALYSASNRTDIKCIIHLTSTNAVTLSIMKCGLLPLCSEAMTVGDISYAEFNGSTEDLGEALGPTNKVLVLRNRGIMICGSSVEESFHLAFNVMAAVDVQMTLAAFGLDKVHLPSEDTCRNIYDNNRRPPVGATGTKRRWRRGELEFEAMMRQLDNVGCQTGYVYQDIAPTGSLVKRDRSGSDADLAPFLSGAGSFGGSDRELSRLGGSPLKIPKRSATPCEWRASPTVYNKEQIVEKTFDRQEKKITKWVPADAACTSKSAVFGASTKLENPNQFAPQGINPAELKEKVKAIRRDYFNDRVSAGPQSRILEGINWNEAQALKETATSATSESTISGVTAVSKGVIQREHQHTATVLCKNLFDPPNPFNRMSGDDIELYKSNVEHKVRAGGDSTQDDSEAQIVSVTDDNEP